MILEEIDGDVKVVLNGKALSINDSIEDAQWPLVAVLGKGKATFRVDPSCTVEVKGVAVVVEEAAPAPASKAAPKAAPKVEAAPVAERVTPPMETPGEAATET
jgi:hypothetical protein